MRKAIFSIITALLLSACATPYQSVYVDEDSYYIAEEQSTRQYYGGYPYSLSYMGINPWWSYGGYGRYYPGYLGYGPHWGFSYYGPHFWGHPHYVWTRHRYTWGPYYGWHNTGLIPWSTPYRRPTPSDPVEVADQGLMLPPGFIPPTNMGLQPVDPALWGALGRQGDLRELYSGAKKGSPRIGLAPVGSTPTRTTASNIAVARQFTMPSSRSSSGTRSVRSSSRSTPTRSVSSKSRPSRPSNNDH